MKRRFSLRLKIVSSTLLFQLLFQFVLAARPAYSQQTEKTERKTRVCAIEDETEVEPVNGQGTSRRLTPGYCVDCWIGYGCGAPFLAAGLLGLLGGTTGAAIAGGAIITGGILGGIAATGGFDGNGNGGGNPVPVPTLRPGVPPPQPTRVPGGPQPPPSAFQ